MSANPGDGSGEAEAPSHLSAGFLVGGGRYTLVRQIAKGGMGVVWLAHDERLSESVALKFLSSTLRNDPVELARLRQETQKSRKLTHANIIRIYDLYEAPGEPAFISMEYVNGPNLWEWMTQQAKGVFAWTDLKPLVKQLCDALSYAHGERVIHRDLKPTNFMLAQNQRLKLADFGLAAVAMQVDPSSVERRFGGGTLTHMSPQQLAGEVAAVTDDIYSLGATLYHLLCGQPPFHEGDIGHQLRTRPPPPLQEKQTAMGVSNDVPPEVAAMIMACLAKDPSRRPQSVSAVAEWIGLADKGSAPAAVLASTVFTAPKASPPEEEPPPRRGAWRWLIASGLLACIGLVLWLKRPSPPPSVNPIIPIQSNVEAVTTNAPVPVSVPVAKDSYKSAVLALSPLAFWRLDETHGSTAFDLINGYDGVYLNVLLGQPGPDGASKLAAQLAPANDQPSIVTIPGPDLAVPNGGNGKFTVTLWLQASAESNAGETIISKGYGGDEQFALDCGGRDGTFRFFFRDSGGSTCWTRSSAKSEGKWHFLAGVCDQAKSRVYIYVDGTNAGESSTTVNTGIRASSLPIVIGACKQRQGLPYAAPFTGPVADVAIFTNALSAAQIMALYQTSGKPVPTPAETISVPKTQVLLDPTFDAGIGADGEIDDLALQSDGGILVAGHFNTFDGITHRGLVRLKSNGKLDYPRADIDGPVNAIAVLPDGRVIIAGDFTMVSSLARPRLARLLPNLTLDPSWDLAEGPDKEVDCMTIVNNNHIFLGGAFQHFGEAKHSGVVRLDANGHIDPTFKSGPGANGPVLSAAAQPDGRVLIGGNFTRYHNSGHPRLNRIHLDGAVQNIFRSDVNGAVLAIVLQRDGKILIGGEFDIVHKTHFKGIARLNGNGSLDGSFNPGSGVDRAVRTVALQSNDKIIIGGDFTAINGVPCGHLARLNPDGSLDRTFAPKLPGAEVRKVLVQRDGKILAACQSTGGEGALRANVVRLKEETAPK